MSALDNSKHSVIIHIDQMNMTDMQTLVEVARNNGYEPLINELGFYLDDLSENEANKIVDGLRKMGINPLGGISY